MNGVSVNSMLGAALQKGSIPSRDLGSGITPSRPCGPMQTLPTELLLFNDGYIPHILSILPVKL